jgi:hypothetical protein
MPGPPAWAVVAQDYDTGHLATKAIEDAIVVDEHAFGEIGVGLALHLDVDQYPSFLAIALVDPEQLVGQAGAQGAIGIDLLQLFVERFVAAAPVDGGGDNAEPRVNYCPAEMEPIMKAR